MTSHGAGAGELRRHAADAAALGDLGVSSRACRRRLDGGLIALQLAVDRPDLVQTLGLLRAAAAGRASASLRRQAAFAAYRFGDRDGAMSRFLSVVSSLDWKPATGDRAVHPGSVARDGATSTIFGGFCPPCRPGSSGPRGRRPSAGAAPSVGHGQRAAVPGWPRAARTWFPPIGLQDRGRGHLLHMQRPEPVARVSPRLLRPPSHWPRPRRGLLGLGASRRDLATLMAETIRPWRCAAPPARLPRPAAAADDRSPRRLAAEAHRARFFAPPPPARRLRHASRRA